MDKKNIILIPVDFSEESLVAIDYAKLIAPMFRAKIHMLHVLEGKNPILKFVSDNDKPIIEKKIAEKLENIVDQIERKYFGKKTFFIKFIANIEEIKIIKNKLPI